MTADRMSVLGTCGAWPEPGRACSGFVLHHDGRALVLDLGWGTYPGLSGALGGDALDGVVVSHEHPDHMADLGALLRERWFTARDEPALPFLGTPGVRERLCGGEPDAADVLDRVVVWHDLPSARVDVGPFAIEAIAVPHHVPAVAVRVATAAWSLVYTGDTGPSEDLTPFARGADLLLAEASDRGQQPAAPRAEDDPPLHLDASGAGRLATRAGVGRLVLTHFWPGNDREETRRAAVAHTDVDVVVAREGLEVPLPR